MRISDWSSDLCSSDLLRGTLIYFDLDNFKKVNDVHGHQAGDEVLKGVAVAVRKTLRVVDLASRIGGDEFLVWLEETGRSEEHTSDLQSLMRISYAVFCLKTKNTVNRTDRLARAQYTV